MDIFDFVYEFGMLNPAKIYMYLVKITYSEF